MSTSESFKKLLDISYALKYSIKRSPAVSTDEKVVFCNQLGEMDDIVRHLAALAGSIDRTMQKLDAQLQSYDVENGDLKIELEKSGDFVSHLMNKNQILEKRLAQESRDASDYKYDYHQAQKKVLKLEQEIIRLKMDLAFKKLEER